MKAIYDLEPIELSQRTVDAIKEYMTSFCLDMQKNEPEFAECWTWGMCTVRDLAQHDLSFEFGGEDDEPPTKRDNQIFIHIPVKA